MYKRSVSYMIRRIPSHRFRWSGQPGLPSQIAYVLNGSEARILGGVDEPAEAASRIASQYGAEVVVIKRGPRGALVYENGRHEWIPHTRLNLSGK